MIRLVFVFALVFNLGFLDSALAIKDKPSQTTIDRKLIKKQLSQAIEAAEDWLWAKKEEHLLELNQIKNERWGDSVYQRPSIDKLRAHVLKNFLHEVKNYLNYFNKVIDSVLEPLQPLGFVEIEWLDQEYKDYIDFQAKCAVEVQRIEGEE